MARHSSMIGGRSLGRQLSSGQGKRLSARALLGAFGPMGLSAVLFDLQGKIDADQLQAAQVDTALCMAKQARFQHPCNMLSIQVVLALPPKPLDKPMLDKTTVLCVLKEWIIANARITIAVLGTMPGSEGNHSQTAKHRQ